MFGLVEHINNAIYSFRNQNQKRTHQKDVRRQN